MKRKTERRRERNRKRITGVEMLVLEERKKGERQQQEMWQRLSDERDTACSKLNHYEEFDFKAIKIKFKKQKINK